MRFLLIHTCAAGVETGGVIALADETGVVAAEELPGRGTSEALMPALSRLLSRASWIPADIGAVGVVNGPGSFTGVRVGLSAAKGLCEAVGAGMLAMSRLALVAESISQEERIIAVLDAGRGELFCAVYSGEQQISEAICDEDRARERIAEGIGVTCERRVAERMGIRLVEEPGATAMLAMARRMVAAGTWSDVATVDANYLRRTDAEVKLERSNR